MSKANLHPNPLSGYSEDYPDPDEFDFDNEYDADDEEYDDCGLMPDGQCTKAGSEECDWICGALHRARP